MAHKPHGYEGHIGFGVQTALNTAASRSTWITFDSETMHEPEPNKQFQPELGSGRRFEVSVSVGRTHVEGTITMNLKPDTFPVGLGLANLMGTGSATGNTVSGDADGGYTHSFLASSTMSDLSEFGVTIEVFRGGTGNTLCTLYVGCFITSYKVMKQENGAIKCEISFIGSKELTNQTKSTPSLTTKVPFESTGATLKLGADLANLSAVDAKTFEFTMNSGVEMLYGSGRYPVAVSYGRPECSLSFSLDHEGALTLYNYWKNNDLKAMELELTHSQLAGDVSNNYNVKIQAPAISFTGDPFNTSDSGVLQQSMTATVTQPQTGSDTFPVKIISVDSVEGTYDV